jgi:hypothetical protein
MTFKGHIDTLVPPFTVELIGGRPLIVREIEMRDDYIVVLDPDGRRDIVPFTAIARIRVDNVQVKQ